MLTTRLFTLVITLLPVFGLRADGPPASLRIANAGLDSEGLQTFRLEWDAISNATYLVQSADSLAPGSPWNTIDAVRFSDTVGSYQFSVVATDSTGLRSQVAFYRLLLPQPEIFVVEPAVLAPGVAADVYVAGQCFGSNDVLRINGVAQTGVVYLNSALLSRPAFTPATPGTYVFELVVAGQVRSSFTLTCADGFTNPELVLQGPPEDPPASPIYIPAGEVQDCSPNMYRRVLTGGYGWNVSDATARAIPNFIRYQLRSKTTEAKVVLGGIKTSEESFRAELDSRGGGFNGPFNGGLNGGFNGLELPYDPPTSIKPPPNVMVLLDATRSSPGPQVCPSSGEVCYEVVDMFIPGCKLDFILARTYRSRCGHRLTLDDRWAHSYDVRCAQNSSGGIDVEDGTGRKDTFTLQSNGTYACPGMFREGTLTGGVFRLTFADTGYWEFNPFDPTSPDSKLAQIVDRNGNTMTLAYDGAGRLTQIVDDLNRTNVVSYTSDGRVHQVTDFSGRAVTYAYYNAGETGGSPGDLKSVTSPAVTGTPNKNDFPAGKTTTYTYSSGYADDRENHLLLSVFDAGGQKVYDHVYQHNQTDLEFLRCVSLQRWTNTPTVFTYLFQTPTPANQYAAVRCIVNDPVGNVTECFYDARNRCVKLQEFTGRATAGLPVTATVNRPVGKLRASDPDYYECRAEWNNDSLCQKLYLFGGQQVQCLYESDFDKSTVARKRADLRVERKVAPSPVDLDGDGLADATELVSRFTYDPRFGSDPTARKAKTSEAIVNVKKSYDCARGPRQTTSLDGTYNSEPESWDGTIKGGASAKVIKDRDTGRSKGFGFVVSATDPRGNVTTGSYDANGNCRQVRLTATLRTPRSEDIEFAYNSYGQLTAITNAPDANGRSRVDTIEYYTSGTQSGFIKIRDVDSAPDDGRQIRTTYEYDTRGNVTRVIDPRTNDWLFTWNALDQCVRFQTPVNISARCATDYFYDENDNPVQCSTEVRNSADTLVTSKTDHYRYNPLHLVTRTECAVDASQSMTNDFVYNGNDQCVLELGGDAVSGAEPHQRISYEYDESGLLFRESSAVGGPDQSTTQYDYDANGNLTRVSEGLEGTPQVTTLEYDAFELKDRVQICHRGTSTSRPQIGRARFAAESGFGSSSSPIAEGTIRGLRSEAIAMRAKEDTDLIAGKIGHRFDVPRIAPGSSSPQIAGRGAHLSCTRMARADYDSCSRISKITDPMGNQTTFVYDANDNLRVMRQYGELNDVPGTAGNLRLAESRYEYDGLDQCVRSRDLFFDPATQAAIGDGERTTTFTYAANGQCTGVTDDLGRVTSYAYDTAGRHISSTAPGGKTIQVMVVDQVGNTTSVAQTDRSDLGGPPQVFSRTNIYDTLNRCVSTTDNVGNTSHCAYDSLGRVEVMFNPREYSVGRTYDLRGRCTLAVADLDGDGLLDLAHDISIASVWSSSTDELLSSTDSHGNSTSYSYNAMGLCTQVTHADGTHLSLVWSPRSNLIQEQDANGTVIRHTYDLNDRCISNNITPGGGVAMTTTFETFAYDGCSRLVAAANDGSDSAFAFDSLGSRVRDVSGGLGALTVSDSLGNRTSLTYPSGRLLTYAYDLLDRRTNIVESGASLASFSYDGPDRVGRVSYGNGMRTRIVYDGISGTPNATGDFGYGQISFIRHSMAGGSPDVSAVSLAWDRNQNKTARQDVIFTQPVPRTNTLALEYDPADRLTHAIVSNGSGTIRDTQYGLDRMGNRTNVTGAASCSGNYFMDGAVPGPMDFQMNQYTTTPCDSRTYDDNGNLLSRSPGPGSSLSYSYDYASRLVSVSDSGSAVAAYAYDPLGRRISKTVFNNGGLPPVTTQFLYDGDDVIEERENGAVTSTYVTSLFNQKHGTLLQFRRGGQDYYFHADDQGNVLALTTKGGAVVERYDYDDYGAVTFLTSDGIPTSATSSAVGNVYCWGGLRLDAETGLHNDDGGGYLDTQAGRSLGRVCDGRNGCTYNSPRRTSGRNNPWSGNGGSPSAMEKGTVKFFNESKGFGFTRLLESIQDESKGFSSLIR